METITNYDYEIYKEIENNYPIVLEVCRKLEKEQNEKLYNIIYDLIEYKHCWEATKTIKCNNKALEKEIKDIVKRIEKDNITKAEKEWKWKNLKSTNSTNFR